MTTRDPEINARLHRAIEECDLDALKSGIRANPSFLTDADGNDNLLWMAALVGWLEGVKFLVSQGLDVNISQNVGYGTEYYQPEGAVLQAAGEGHIEVVEWLLSKGAKINFTLMQSL